MNKKLLPLLGGLMLFALPHAKANIYQSGDDVSTLVPNAQTYQWQTPYIAAGTYKKYIQIFNKKGSGTKIRILGIYPQVEGDVAVTGALSISFEVLRTTIQATGANAGISYVYRSTSSVTPGGSLTPFNTNNPALSSFFVATTTPAVTIRESLMRFQCFTEETNQALYICGGQTNFMDSGNYPMDSIVLREGEGMVIMQQIIASVNNIAFRIVFAIEPKK